MEIKLSLRETNSSSAHALLANIPWKLPEVRETKIREPWNMERLNYVLENEYGWGYDTYSDIPSIVHYVLCQAAENMPIDEFSSLMYRLSSRGVINSWTIGGKGPREYYADLRGKIDHQSIWTVLGRTDLFFGWLITHATLGNVRRLLVSNDNGGPDVHDSDMDVLGRFLSCHMSEAVVTRQSGDFMTIISTWGGYKLQIKDPIISTVGRSFSFPGESNKYPVLLDTLITRQCGKQCPYCYIGAKPRGRKASIDTILEFVSEIPPYSIAEVALGGGDVLTNKELLAAAATAFAARGCLVSLTLRPEQLNKNADYLYQLDEMIQGMTNVHSGRAFAVGISIENASDMDELLKGGHMSIVSMIHMINGVTDPKLLDTGVTFKPRLVLGYKRTDYNNEFTPDAEKMIRSEVIRRLSNSGRGPMILFDDLAVQQIGLERGKDIPEEVWDLTYLGKEGTRSWFVDFVDRKHGPCSYNLVNQQDLDPGIFYVWSEVLEV